MNTPVVAFFVAPSLLEQQKMQQQALVEQQQQQQMLEHQQMQQMHDHQMQQRTRMDQQMNYDVVQELI